MITGTRHIMHMKTYVIDGVEYYDILPLKELLDAGWIETRRIKLESCMLIFLMRERWL